MTKQKFKQKLFGVLSAGVIALASLPANVSFAADYQDRGSKDGYDYEVWNQNGQGQIQFELKGDGAFYCSWSNTENNLFRTGKRLGSTQTYDAYDGISIDYVVDYEPKGNSYMCVYGWTENGKGEYPTVEYYIVEAWGDWRPPGNASSMGTVYSDNKKYDIYRTVRYNQPSIHGTETFYQYWSVQDKSPSPAYKKTTISGKITVSNHFDAWKKAGLDMNGKLYEVALNVEGYRSNGSADVKKNDLKFGIGDDDGDDPPVVVPVEPDANGYYFHSTFEDGMDDWASRGEASVEASSAASNAGSKSAAVTGRTDTWHGISRALDTSAFQPGKSYSFSAMAMQDAVASEDFKLTLQYSGSDGEEHYDEVASGSGGKGEWIQLANKSFTIPAGASSPVLYVETADSTNDFYVDELIGAIDGKVITGNTSGPVEQTTTTPKTTTTTTPPAPMYAMGDVNRSGKVDVDDVAAMQSFLLGSSIKLYGPTSDMNGDKKINVYDLQLLKQQLLTGKSVIATTTATTKTTTTAASKGGQSPIAYMSSVRSTLTNSVPASATNGNGTGTVKEITYYSSTAKQDKKASVLLPAGYSESEKYPVMYVNHGIFGTHTDMLASDMKLNALSSNLAASGEAKKMIIVCTSMFTPTKAGVSPGFTAESNEAYDNILQDLVDSLMPYMEKNYSVATGKENTAITGFSMGGREALYVGISRPDLFGYIGAACPAPGVTPAQDEYMVHQGSMTESEFRIKDSATGPSLLMITGGTNDGVVHNSPENYHNLLTKNSTEHVWQSINGTGHGADSVVPHLYNFIRAAFNND